MLRALRYSVLDLGGLGPNRQSGCNLAVRDSGEDAGEIASRLQIRSQATHRQNRVAVCTQHATEISWLPGFDRWRRTGRERWCLAHRVHTGPSRAYELPSQKTPYEPYAQNTTILAQFVATHRTRATLISPGHAACTPLLGCAYTWPGGGSAISRQSRLYLD